MKDSLRTYPALSLCGLCCALCPIHQMQKATHGKAVSKTACPAGQDLL